ncbi:MAG: prepilin-type N-terminal cleavage/methylation domain-containing protein, partial [Candidatus Omnitrophota bacterium]
MNKGFSLVELVISVAILSVLMAGLFLTLNTQQFAYDLTQEKLTLQSEIRTAMAMLSRDLRGAISTDIRDNPDPIPDPSTSYIRANLWHWDTGSNQRVFYDP